ncbi:MAG: hypothetical protein Q9162_006414 [Coniocarpon cinnabarinum]
MSTVEGSEAGMSHTATNLQRSTSTTSTKIGDQGALSRGGTLRKRQSLKKSGSLMRRGSRKSLRAGSIKGMRDDEDSFNSVYHSPVPTSGNPTEVLANRFQAWRKLLKDLITYFREIQTSYEQRSKSLLKVSNVLNNTTAPSLFMSEGGLDDATRILRGFHKQSVTDANKSKDIENDVITQLNGLRSDLSQKIKEIKSLSGDFKNSVEKERDQTRKAVSALQDALAASEADPSTAGGKNDPFIIKLSVDRQVERQIEEENYLHRAYLNLEGSGRELESIVVGEIQKAYNAYAGILRREADAAHSTIDDLRAGPIGMHKDHEWEHFVENDPHFVNPNVPLRSIENIHYPGKFNPAAAEIRAGMLERKSKYLKSYTPGWYVLSPTHLHEFKSADHIHTQQPVMSLCLLDQRLGSKSANDASSHKFSLKGRQSGGVHRGHSWVFRAESFDTMMAWYDDILNLTEKPSAERNEFVRRHARSVSAGSQKASSISSDGVEDDEADEVPYSANQSVKREVIDPPPKRPSPGGRFPSDINVERLKSTPQATSQSSGSSYQEQEPMMAGAVAQSRSAAAPVETQPQQDQSNSSPVLMKQQQTYVGDEPAHQRHSLQRGNSVHNTSSGAGGAGHNSSHEASDLEEPSQGGSKAREPAAMLGADFVGAGTGDAKSTISSSAASTEYPQEVEERQDQTTQTATDHTSRGGLRPTGHLFPSVLRHDTEMSVRQLHVPGEWTQESS